MAVEKGEEEGTCPSLKCFSAKENSLPRNKTVVEDCIRVGVPRRKSPLEVLPVTQVMHGHHLFHPLPVCGNSKSDSPFLLFWQEGTSGNDQNLVCHRSLGNMYLRTPDDDPIALFLDHMDVHVRVFLLAGSLHPVAFDVGLGTTAH